MDKAEFDRFAEEYRNLHQSNIKASGETADFFAEYKVRDTARLAAGEGMSAELEILDFGAGVGNSVPFFRRHFPAAPLTCLDVSDKSLALAAERFPGQADFVSFDGDTIPFADDRFDLAFSACVFHHIPHADHERLLQELLRVLRPDGMLVIFEHNPYNPLTVRAVNTCPFDENAVLISASRLMQRIRDAGFPSVEHAYRIFFPGPLRGLRGLEQYMAWLPLGAQYCVVARKRARA